MHLKPNPIVLSVSSMSLSEHENVPVRPQLVQHFHKHCIQCTTCDTIFDCKSTHLKNGHWLLLYSLLYSENNYLLYTKRWVGILACLVWLGEGMLSKIFASTLTVGFLVHENVSLLHQKDRYIWMMRKPRYRDVFWMVHTLFTLGCHGTRTCIDSSIQLIWFRSFAFIARG